MKALVIAPQPFYTPRGTPLSVYYRTLVASRLGLEMDLLTYGQGYDVDIDGLRIIRIPAFQRLGTVPVGPSLLKAFLDLILFLRMGLLLARNRYDFVHVHEEAAFFCLAWQPVFKFRYVYDMHSSLPRQLANFEFTRSALITDLFERLERRALRGADAVITVCQDLFDYARTLLPDESRIVLIENSLFDPVRLASAVPVSDHEFDSWDHSEENRLIFYAGTLEPYQGIDLLLRAFACIAPTHPETLLLIAGGNQEQVERYREQAKTLGLGGQCRFVGTIPRTDAVRWSRRAHLLVSPRTTGTNVPLKIYEQLASGIPLLATDVYAHTQVLSDEVAFLAPPEPEAFADAMRSALENDSARRERVRKAGILYASRYDDDAYLAKMKQLLEFVS